MAPRGRSSYTYPTLFRVFLYVYVATAALALLGIVAEFAFPPRKMPFLWQLVSVTLIETSIAVVYEFRRRSILESQPVTSEHGARGLVVHSLKLFKSALESGSGKETAFRLSFLRYDPANDSFRMFAQDDDYGDSHFETRRQEGLAKGIVVCEAFDKGGLHSRNLAPDAYFKYQDTPISPLLKAVMACPVRGGDGRTVGVLALDAEHPFEELDIAKPRLESLFMKLCKLIELESDALPAVAA